MDNKEKKICLNDDDLLLVTGGALSNANPRERKDVDGFTKTSNDKDSKGK